MSDVRRETRLKFFQLIFVDNLPLTVVVEVQEEYVFDWFLLNDLARILCLVIAVALALRDT